MLKLHCGAMQHEVALGVAIFDKEVGGGYCKWNMLKLFAAMGLADGRATTHLPGRWVASSWQAWSRKASQLRLPPSAVLKPVATDKNGGADASEKDGRVLPWPSVSTPMLISLLARWCSLPREMGWQELASNRQAALEMLEAICRVCHQSAFELRAFVDESVKRRWPAEAEGVREVRLQVEIGGQVQVRPLQLVIEGAGIISQAAWSSAVGDEPAISLLDLVRTCCRQEVRAVELWMQVVWEVSSRFEAMLMQARDGVSVFAHMSVEVVGWNTSDTYQLQRKLMSYIDGCRQRWISPKYLSVTTDKSRVHGRALQNSLFVAPSNEAFWAPPQVLIGCVRGSGRLSEASALGSRPLLGYPNIAPEGVRVLVPCLWTVSHFTEVRAQAPLPTFRQYRISWLGNPLLRRLTLHGFRTGTSTPGSCRHYSGLWGTSTPVPVQLALRMAGPSTQFVVSPAPPPPPMPISGGCGLCGHDGARPHRGRQQGRGGCSLRAGSAATVVAEAGTRVRRRQ